MAENEQINPGDRKPDISFGSFPDTAPSANDPAGQRSQAPQSRSVRQASSPNDVYRGQGFDRPSQGEASRPTHAPNGGYRGQGGDNVAGARQSNRGKAMRRPESDPANDIGSHFGQNGQQVGKQRKKSPAPEPKRSRAAKEEPRKADSFASVSAGGAAAAASAPTAMKKKKFSKKQAFQVTGLIIMLILILGLAVFLVFDHYYNLFKHSADDVSNSSPMTYSDVDFSRADTFEKAKEDEKLKELTAKADKITSDEVMNILLIGEDLRDTTEERSVGNTDVMMLISVNKKDNTITLTSLMRDCYVGFEDDNGYWYSDRINSAYWYGGMRLTKNVIEDYMKVHIDRYVLVNFKVFIDIVDALGGIDMYVSDLEANGDPDAPRSDKEHRGMQNPLDEQNKYLGNKVKTDYIKKGGNLHLNGNQALAYARLRYVGDADFDRTKRQRKVINEMIKESRRMSLVQMDQLANKVFPQVTTDVTMGELAGLLLEMLNYRNYKVQEMRVPADGTFTNEFIDGKAVLSVDFEQNVQLFREKAYGTVEFKEKEKSEHGKALE